MAEREDFELTYTFEDNQVVRVSVDFEEGHALRAIQALTQAGNQETSVALLSQFRDDPSVREKLEKLNMSFDDDEDDW